MPIWINSLVFAVLVVVIPYTLTLQILLRLPRPLALSHHRWPTPLNFALIAVITAYVTVFIRSVYYGRPGGALTVLLQFAIVAVAYVFGLVLMIRQFEGVYPEYIVTTGFIGLPIRKTVYRHIGDVQEVSKGQTETTLRIDTQRGGRVQLTLPNSLVPIFYKALKSDDVLPVRDLSTHLRM